MVKAISAVIAAAALCSVTVAFPPTQPDAADELAVGADGENCHSVRAAFRDVAAQSGIDYVQHERTSAPNCIFDEPLNFHTGDVKSYGIVQGREGEASAESVKMVVNAMAKDVGGFCFPERNCGGAAATDLNGDGLV